MEQGDTLRYICPEKGRTEIKFIAGPVHVNDVSGFLENHSKDSINFITQTKKRGLNLKEINYVVVYSNIKKYVEYHIESIPETWCIPCKMVLIERKKNDER